jgi:opacity protein-like surface antigen
MRDSLHQRLVWVVAVALVSIVAASVANGQEEWSRAGRSDIFFVVQTVGSDKVTAFDGFAEGEIDAFTSFGGGIGSNFGDHLYLSMELMFGSTTFVTTIPSIPGASSSLDATAWQWNINLDYNILKGRLTPLVSGGIGLFGWSGDEFSESNFSYNLGAGGRWDITDNIVLRVLYRITWTTIEDADEAYQFDGVMATIGYMFK